MAAQPEAERDFSFPVVRSGISPMAPWRWVSRGLDDLKWCPSASLFFGGCFAAMGLVLNTVFARHYEYTSALVCGFLLVAPFFAIGLYEISRRRTLGASCELRPTLAAWRTNAGNIGLYSLILTVVFLVWARASLITFALFYTSALPTLDDFVKQVVSFQNIEFLVAYVCVGLLFAILVFAFSVVSIPLMLDRDQDAVTAMIASFLALVRNPLAMAVWALVIVGFTVIGFATLYIGLVFAMPVVGHATWHAYQELVEPRPLPGRAA
ncbi:MAG: DUF2189 domain-containing protein [Rhodocyclaceae bacterium]